MHATEWIQQHGRHLRQISAGDLRKRLDRPKRHCTWCGEPVGKGRRTWCSDDCYREFASRCDPQTIRRQVGGRDKGVCAECGVDTDAHKKLMKATVTRMQAFYGLFDVHSFARRKGRRWLPCRCPACTIEDQFAWEADHIVPVIEGGGLTGIDNFRTLCLACHKRASAELAARRAAARRPADRQMRLAGTN